MSSDQAFADTLRSCCRGAPASHGVAAVFPGIDPNGLQTCLHDMVECLRGKVSGTKGATKELSQRLFSEPKRAETRKVRFLVNILMSNIKFPKFPGKVDWALYCAPVKLMENSTLISQVCSSKWPLSYAAGLRKSCGPPCPLLRQSHFDCAIHLLRFIS
jgi:hypothetical protein